MSHTKKNTGYKVIIALLLLVLPVKGAYILADDISNQVGDPSNLPVERNEDLGRRKELKTNQFLRKIQSEIGENQQHLAEINKDVIVTSKKVEKTRAQVDTLANQIANLDQQIRDTMEIIENVRSQIKRREGEIQQINVEVELKNVQISNQKQMLLEYLEVLYREQNNIRSMVGGEQEINTLKMLLSNDSASQELQSIHYSEILQQTGQEIFNSLQQLKDGQEKAQKMAQVKKRELLLLNNTLVHENDELGVQQRAKSALLDQTKGQEAIYAELLKQSKLQQEQVIYDLESLNTNLEIVKKKMALLGDEFNPDNYMYLLKMEGGKVVFDYLSTLEGNNLEFQPRWPVSPNRGISAYFREASYAKVFGMQHNAIDVPTPQSTPIRAPADGVVYKAKDNGYGYSYIILAHGNGFLTIYGHVSDIQVEVGQIIKSGEIIGLSGAMPGTKGAGVYTTGPHLHFEVMKDGKYIDPLQYLNLAYLPFDALPSKYQARALGDKEKVKREESQVESAFNDDELVQMVETTERAKPLTN